MDTRVITCEITRQESSEGIPYKEVYQVPFRNGMTILELFRYIADEIDGSFAFYEHSCKRGFCGSCLVKVNGKKQLTCRTLISEKDVMQTLKIEPALKISKDLWILE